MKIFKKAFAVIAVIILICAAFPLTSSASGSVLEAAGVLGAIDSDGKAFVGSNSVPVRIGGKLYAFAFLYDFDPDDPKVDCYNFVTGESNDRYTVRLLKNLPELDLFLFEFDPSDKPLYMLPADSESDLGDECAVVYYDEGEVYSEADVTELRDNLYTLEGPLGKVRNGAFVTDADGSRFYGIFYNDVDSFFALSIDYLRDKFSLPDEKAGSADSGDSDSGSGDKAGLFPVIAGALVLALVAAAVIVIFGRGRKKREDDGYSNTALLGGTEELADEDGAFPVTAPARYCIRGVGGVHGGEKFEITGRTVLGRQPGACNIVYPPDTRGVSGIHCELRPGDSGLEITDLGSSYGTFVNGQQLAPRVPRVLHPGDSICLANSDNVFTVYN